MMQITKHFVALFPALLLPRPGQAGVPDLGEVAVPNWLARPHRLEAAASTRSRRSEAGSGRIGGAVHTGKNKRLSQTGSLTPLTRSSFHVSELRTPSARLISPCLDEGLARDFLDLEADADGMPSKLRAMSSLATLQACLVQPADLRWCHRLLVARRGRGTTGGGGL